MIETISKFIDGLGLGGNILFFLVGFLLLIKGGDWFVDGSTAVARRFRIPEIIVGATVVSIGTTLPEVLVSATAAIEGHGEIAYGNAIGSVICNTALIAALTAAVRPGTVDRKSLRTPVLFFFGSAAFYILNAYINKGFPRWSGMVLLAVFVVYMILSVRQGLNKKDELPAGGSDGGQQGAQEDENEKEKDMPLGKALVLLVVGAACIALGAKLLVDHGTKIAGALGVPESVIALTFVALGTSLPELVTAITSLAKGHSALSLGNVIGANLFNLVLVSGTAITISPFNLPVEKTIAGMNASLVVDVPLMLVVMWILTVPALAKGKMSRWQGILLLALYAAFCVFQFVG
ncbi:MAG: calcium/sodium antiporter [Clostridia bacterium]|nr:calcium/sodium antiporter [Clostridia bacterium]